MNGAPLGAFVARSFVGLPAPAKINLFLHVTGRRADGYHELQSVFVPVGLADLVDVRLRDDGRIERDGDLTGPPEQDLAVRAARALQAADPRAASLGASISVEKRIPVGAGLGGGSSDAATTLIALNRLWNLDLPRERLAQVGARLGADIPFFLGTGSAFVEGAGERCTVLVTPPAWYLVIYPQVHVSTAEIFSDPKLTRTTKQTTIAGFSASVSALGLGGNSPLFGENDLEAVARRKFAAVDAALRLLANEAPARMSGSGSAVFCVTASREQAHSILERVRGGFGTGWKAWIVAGLATLPLADW